MFDFGLNLEFLPNPERICQKSLSPFGNSFSHLESHSAQPIFFPVSPLPRVTPPFVCALVASARRLHQLRQLISPPHTSIKHRTFFRAISCRDHLLHLRPCRVTEVDTSFTLPISCHPNPSLSFQIELYHSFALTLRMHPRASCPTPPSFAFRYGLVSTWSTQTCLIFIRRCRMSDTLENMLGLQSYSSFSVEALSFFLI